MPRTPSSRRKTRRPLSSVHDNNNSRSTPNHNQKKKKKRPSPTSARRGSDCHSKRQKQQQQREEEDARNNNTSTTSNIHQPIPNTNDTEALPFPDTAVLNSMDSACDRHLQVLLWEIDCHYVLLKHQFKGVRAMAGLADDFPGVHSPPPPAQEAKLLEWVLTHLTVTAKPRDDRGVLMADVMGLGKTVQCVAACMLRNAMALAQGKPKKPTLIVSPNDAVSTQWFETLIKANVHPKAIYRFRAKQSQQVSLQPKLKEQVRFYLCNRYDLQTEARYCFEKLKTDATHFHKSPLFPNADRALLKCLQNQYLAEQGKAKNWFKQGGGSNIAADQQDWEGDRMNISEIITKSLSKYVGEFETVFETVVIDEAHFLKNLAAYWGMAAGLLGLHTNRMIPMSGTPYNNSCQDVATLMTMIDSRLDSANEKWWKNATKRSAAKDVQEAIQEWSDNYLIRRDKSVIAHCLPQKIIRKKHVGPLPLELSIYEDYEGKFLSILQKFQKLEHANQNLYQRQQMKKYFELMLAFASCMRCALIHPLLAGGGREFTVLFSPSRRNRKGMLCSQEKPNKCVCCGKNNRTTKKKKKAKKANPNNSLVGDFEGEFEDDDDDAASLVDFIVADNVVEWEDDEYYGGDKKPKAKASKKKEKNLMESDAEAEEVDVEAEKEEKRQEWMATNGINHGHGEMAPISDDICPLAAHGVRHFACQSCLVNLEECPACNNAQARLRLEHGKNELMKKKMEAGKLNKDSASGSEEAMDIDIPRKLYCQHIFGGFRASAKLESIIEDYHQLPDGDKVLVCSFFKGSLDLLEAIFHELKVETARFDGDVCSEERQMELDRFKENERCRVLLVTVQTGGTGLNLVNANHVWFVDRFWNPMVMEQAEDRCYRMGQKKDVHITYHDVNYTTDDVMRHINDAKSQNAKIILADGAELSTSTSGMSFKDISGQLGDSVRAIQAARLSYVASHKQHIYQPLPPSPAGVFESMEKDTTRSANAHGSLLDAIASMLGYAIKPLAPTSTPRKSTCGTTLPMQVGILGTPLGRGSSGLSRASAQPDQSTSDAAPPFVESKPDHNTSDSKASILPPQTKSEPSVGTVPSGEERTDVKPPSIAMPDRAASEPTMAMPDRATSEPNRGASIQVINLDSDDDEDSIAENKENNKDALKSSVKAETTTAGAPKQKKAKSWLDDDSDDDSIPEVVELKKGQK